jgi:hypothetical protein
VKKNRGEEEEEEEEEEVNNRKLSKHLFLAMLLQQERGICGNAGKFRGKLRGFDGNRPLDAVGRYIVCASSTHFSPFICLHFQENPDSEIHTPERQDNPRIDIAILWGGSLDHCLGIHGPSTKNISVY